MFLIPPLRLLSKAADTVFLRTYLHFLLNLDDRVLAHSDEILGLHQLPVIAAEFLVDLDMPGLGLVDAVVVIVGCQLPAPGTDRILQIN